MARDLDDALRANPCGLDAAIERAEFIDIAARLASGDLDIDDDDGPVPLPDPGEPAPFPVEALGPTLCAAARAMESMTQAPLAICAASALAEACLVSQGHINVRWSPVITPAPVSLLLVTVARSGERKSAVDSIALEPVRRWQADRDEEVKHALQAWQNECDLYKRERAAILGKGKGAPSSREDRARRLEELGSEPERPMTTNILTSDATIEGLMRLLAEERSSVGLFADEGGVFVAGAAMNQDNRIKTSSRISSLWTSGAADKVRASERMPVLWGRRICMHIMIQPRLALELFADEALRDQGLFGRTLIVFPASNIGARLSRPDEAAIAQRAEEDLAPYHKRSRELLDRPMPSEAHDPRALKPSVMAFDQAGQEALRAFGDEVELEMAPGAHLEDIVSLAAKAVEHAARLAAVTAFFEWGEAVELTEDDAARGIALARFFMAEALRIRGFTVEAEEVRLARELFDLVKAKGVDAFNRRWAMRHSRRFPDSEAFDQALSVLTERGLAVPAPGSEVDGRRARAAWRLREPREAEVSTVNDVST